MWLEVGSLSIRRPCTNEHGFVHGLDKGGFAECHASKQKA